MGWYSESRRKSTGGRMSVSAGPNRSRSLWDTANNFHNSRSNYSNRMNPDGSITSTKNKRRSRRSSQQTFRTKTQYGQARGLRYGSDQTDSSESNSYKDVEETIEVVNPYGDEEALQFNKTNPGEVFQRRKTKRRLPTKSIGTGGYGGASGTYGR